MPLTAQKIRCLEYIVEEFKLVSYSIMPKTGEEHIESNYPHFKLVFKTLIGKIDQDEIDRIPLNTENQKIKDFLKFVNSTNDYEVIKEFDIAEIADERIKSFFKFMKFVNEASYETITEVEARLKAGIDFDSLMAVATNPLVNGYKEWVERFQRVNAILRSSDLTVDEHKAYQLFLLDFGQFNANFNLEELERFNYPKSPFLTLYDKFYMRELDTWAMQILRANYQLELSDQAYPVFIDSEKFYQELEHYCYTIKFVGGTISDDECLKLYNRLTSEEKVEVWVELSEVITPEEYAKNYICCQIIRLKAEDFGIPEGLVTLFQEIYKKREKIKNGYPAGVYVSDDEIAILSTLFPDTVTQFAIKQSILHTNILKQLSESIDDQSKWTVAKIHALKYGKLLGIIVAEQQPMYMNDLSAKNPEQFIALLRIIVQNFGLVPIAQPTIEDFKQNIIARIDQRISSFAAKLEESRKDSSITYYFKGNYAELPSIILSTEQWWKDGFVHKTINRMGYYIDPIRATKKVLEIYPLLFIDAEETRQFWLKLMKTWTVRGLKEEGKKDEKDRIKKLGEIVVSAIGAHTSASYHEIFDRELVSLKRVQKDISESFKIYAKYLIKYLQEYQARYKDGHHIRLLADAEIKQALTNFIVGCKTKNLAKAVRAVQTVAEIMLMDFDLSPQSKLLDGVVKSQLSHFLVKGTLVVPYGMRAFTSAVEIVDSVYSTAEKACKMFITSQTYYEFLDGFDRIGKEICQIQQISDITPDADVIIVELHPNNANTGLIFNW